MWACAKWSLSSDAELRIKSIIKFPVPVHQSWPYLLRPVLSTVFRIVDQCDGIASRDCGHRVTRGVVFERAERDEFFIAITFGITDTDLFIDISK